MCPLVCKATHGEKPSKHAGRKASNLRQHVFGHNRQTPGDARCSTTTTTAPRPSIGGKVGVDSRNPESPDLTHESADWTAGQQACCRSIEKRTSRQMHTQQNKTHKKIRPRALGYIWRRRNPRGHEGTRSSGRPKLLGHYFQQQASIQISAGVGFGICASSRSNFFVYPSRMNRSIDARLFQPPQRFLSSHAWLGRSVGRPARITGRLRAEAKPGRIS